MTVITILLVYIVCVCVCVCVCTYVRVDFAGLFVLTLDSDWTIGKSNPLFFVSALGVLSAALYCSHEGDPTSIIATSLSMLSTVKCLLIERSCEDFLLHSGSGSALVLEISCVLCIFSTVLFSFTSEENYRYTIV